MKNSAKKSSSVKKVLKKIKPYSFYLILALVSAIISVSLTLYIPVLTGNAIDNIIDKGNVDFASVIQILVYIGVGIGGVAKDCSQGLDYGQYAAILLLFHKGNTLAMRTMDVEEAYVQTQEGYENFQMDHVLCETELTATYEFQPVFLGFVSILENFSNGFRIQNHSGYSYFHGKEGM